MQLELANAGAGLQTAVSHLQPLPHVPTPKEACKLVISSTMAMPQYIQILRESHCMSYGLAGLHTDQ